MDTVDDAITKPVHRLEVFTGAGRRRTWSDADTAQIVAEILGNGESLSAVARRHGLSPQQLFGWRRQLQALRSEFLDEQEPSFVPAVLNAPSSPSVRRQREMPRRQVDPSAGTIEVALDGMTVRIGPGCHDSRSAASIERWHVIGPTGAVRVMVATKPVDFRKGADGLAALVRETNAADPFSGAVYVFRAKRADRIKLVFWDGTGLCLCQTAGGWHLPLAKD